MNDRALPLDGIVVLDLGQVYQGPYCGFLLAQSGARVIKIEPPRGEPIRGRGPTLPLAMLNAGKESTCIDLKDPRGLGLFLELAKRADVVLMNYAPGVPERLGIGASDLEAVNPRLIHAQASGFGVRNVDGSPVETGLPAMDLTIQATSGAMSVTGRESDPPLKSGAASIDFLGGAHLYGAIVTALFERERTGVGRAVEVAMADAAHFALATALGQWQKTGSTLRTGNRHAGLGVAPYNVYECTDGHIAIITVVNRHWRSMIEAMDRPELADDERLHGLVGRAQQIDEVDAIVHAWTSTRTRAEAVAALQAAHVPVAAVRTVDEAVRDEDRHARRALQWVDHRELGQVPLAASPIRYQGSPIVELESERQLGADNGDVFAGLAGLTAVEIDALHAAGITAPI